MKASFSTLACPEWKMPEIIAMAARESYDGIELRFVEGEDSLWKLPVFSGKELASTRRSLADHGLTISCLDTSCRFHSPDACEREHWLAEGKRMADLAAELGALGLRVFGDTIQPGANRASTEKWISESMRELAEIAVVRGVEIWIENHGDFAGASETAAILQLAACPNVGVVWDPANSFVATQEQPRDGAARLGMTIRHVHIKDLHMDRNGWNYVLTGEGVFALSELKAALQDLRYQRFLSFEWEKKWHPEIAEADIALPHFARWFRNNYA